MSPGHGGVRHLGRGWPRPCPSVALSLPPGPALPSPSPGQCGRPGRSVRAAPAPPSHHTPPAAPRAPRPGPPQRDGAGAAGPGALDNLGRVCRDQAAAAGGRAESRLGLGTQRDQPPPGAGRVRHTGTAAGAAAGAAGPLGWAGGAGPWGCCCSQGLIPSSAARARREGALRGGLGGGGHTPLPPVTSPRSGLWTGPAS